MNSATAPDVSPTAATITPSSNSTDTYATLNVPNPSLYDNLTMTGSVYLRVPSGTLNTYLFLINNGDQGWSGPPRLPITVTTTWQRFSMTGTSQNGMTQFYMQIGGGGSFTPGQTLQVWGPQMVIGTLPGTYTPTTTTTTSPVTGQTATLVSNGLNEAYRYDAFGNILQNGGFNNVYTANNQLFGYSYDAAGNVLSTGSVYNLVSMTWDAENRLKTGGGATYIYDAGGDRVETQGVGVTDTVYFGGVPIARLVAGQWTDLIYGPTGLLAEVAGTENADPVYRLTDHLGTQVGSVDSHGILFNPMDYTPWGRPAGSTNDPFRYTGLEHDAETGLEHATFRQLSPVEGRWLSPDPYSGSYNLANPQSFNRYSYVMNRPLIFTDPTGQFPCVATPSPGVDIAVCAGMVTGDFVCGPVCGAVLGGVLGGVAVVGEVMFGGFFAHPTFHGTLKQKPQVDCSKPPPVSPISPQNADLATNVQSASQQTFSQWLKSVAPQGKWDYAHLNGQAYASFGNYNYGATCFAQGLSLIQCQQGAGMAAYGTSIKNVLQGGKWTAGPGSPISPQNANGAADYGDQPQWTENRSVINGYNSQLYKQTCSQ